MIKPYIHKQMVSSDKKRVELLQEFVEILECSEDKNNTLLEDWLSKFKKSNAILTP